MAKDVKVPDDLFAPGQIRPPASEADLVRAETELAVSLPIALRRVLGVQDGGYLRLTTFRLKTKPPKKWSTRREYFVNELPGAAAGETLVAQRNLARLEWGVPEGLLPLCGDGHWWCCLDYRSCGPQGEPAITHVQPEDELEFEVAPDFATLLSGLHRTIEQMEPALIALDDGAPTGPALNALLQGLGCRKHDYPGVYANPSFPLPPTWHWDKYAGLLRDSAVWIQSENNKLYSVSKPKTPLRTGRHPMLTASVSPDQEAACLTELLTALGPGATLIHGVI